MSVSRNLPLIVTLGFHPNILLPEPVMAETNTTLLKTGTREMPHTLTPSGSLIPADALAQLPSEKRAQPEQTMQALAGLPRTHQSTGCMTSHWIRTASSAIRTIRILHDTQTSPSPIRSAISSLNAHSKAGKVHIDIECHWLGASWEKPK